MKPYIHKVHYYETDKMKVVHHSNYIRWMEEARVDFFDQIGFPYAKFEEEGIVSPVVSVEGKFKVSTVFTDEIAITVSIKEFKGVRLIVGYEMKRVSDGVLVFTGTSEHCFINEEGKLLMIKKTHPEFYALMSELADKE